MVEYNIVKKCSICGKRFVVNRREARRYFCNECQSKHRGVQGNYSTSKK